MDEKSRLLIFKLINAGIVDEVNGAINTGKEANVYHGIGSNSEKQITNGEVAIKVYKTTLNEFKHRQPYIREDYRFKDKFAKSNNQKSIYLCELLFGLKQSSDCLFEQGPRKRCTT